MSANPDGDFRAPRLWLETTVVSQTHLLVGHHPLTKLVSTRT